MTAAAGGISLARDTLRTMLADVTAFRAWIGASGSDAQQHSQALERIHDDALPVPDNNDTHTLRELAVLRPFALVSTLSYQKRHDADGSGFEFTNSGIFTLTFEADVPLEIALDQSQIARRFENDLGLILDGLAALAGTGPYLDIEQMGLDTPWVRTHEEERATLGDAVLADVTITWGKS